MTRIRIENATSLLSAVALILVFIAVSANASGEADDSSGGRLAPVRAITKGPKFHWFGYYDKFQFDPTNRYVLGMKWTSSTAVLVPTTSSRSA